MLFLLAYSSHENARETRSVSPLLSYWNQQQKTIHDPAALRSQVRDIYSYENGYMGQCDRVVEIPYKRIYFVAELEAMQ